ENAIEIHDYVSFPLRSGRARSGANLRCDSRYRYIDEHALRSSTIAAPLCRKQDVFRALQGLAFMAPRAVALQWLLGALEGAIVARLALIRPCAATAILLIHIAYSTRRAPADSCQVIA